MTASFDTSLRFYLNGTRVVLDEIDPEATLLEYLRGIGLTGTKLYGYVAFLGKRKKISADLTHVGDVVREDAAPVRLSLASPTQPPNAYIMPVSMRAWPPLSALMASMSSPSRGLETSEAPTPPRSASPGETVANAASAPRALL